MSPLFIGKMLKEKVQALLNEALEERQSLFLIEFSFDNSNNIRVVIDGDSGVSVSDCIDISRAIEHNLDREEHDFALEVMSAGATEPLINRRQYKKNVGRTLEVKDLEGNKTEGILQEATEEGVKLTWKAREPKEVGKGKVTVQKEAVFSYGEIKEARVMIKF